MRLLDNSNTKNLFKSLKESYGCESYKQAAEQAAEEMFDAMTDDIFLNSTSCVQDGNDIKVTLNVTAYGYNDDDDDETAEMNRDVTFTIPLDYTSDGEDMSIDEFYEAIAELIKEWIVDHNSPDNFYEGVEEKKEKKLDESIEDDTKTKDAEDVIQDEEEIPETKETLEIKDNIDIKDEYEFVPLPYELENVLKLSPIYSNDGKAQLPDHDKLVDYLMQQLIEIDPERAEEIKTGKEVEDDIEVQDDVEDYEEIPQEDITIDDEEEDENYD